jgi:tRNA(Ile)-lysidine synthetase-like protein
MTAVSPYAPPRRNSLLRRRSSSIEAGGGGGVGTAVVAVFLLALRFWRDVQYRETVRNFLRRRPTVFQWINKVFLFEKSGDKEQYGGHNDDDDDDATKEPILSKYVQKSSTLQEQSELDRIRENQQLIQKVLQFWFGQYTPDESQKNLWMIAHSSMSLRQRVDQEITEEFKTLLLELAGTTTILEEPTERWTEWCQDAIYGYQGKLAAIIVLDQFSRHMLRHFETNKLSLALPSKTHLDTWALKTAQILADQHSSEIRCGMIPLPMYIFSLMPFRHASTIESVELVQQQIEKCAGLSAQLDAMLGRFRKATNRRMAQLQDEARRSGQKKPTTTEDGSSPTNNVSDEDILETFPFDADMTPARNHPVVKIIQTFLVDRGLKPSKDGSHSGTATPIIISLSGGVDSMVIASVLACLHQSCGFHLNIWAVHIDYGNRPESSAEADFVRRYCEGLNISYKCRRIDEVTRGVTARDDYERIARDLRYTSYKETIALANEGFIGHDKIVTGVMLGHHRGDLRENVLSNAHKGCGPLDLSGMTAVSRNDGVDIYRPLLPLEKTSIFDYAHTFGVPYFKGTCPLIIISYPVCF